VDSDAQVQYRYRAVCEVLGGAPPGEVAQRYGTSRQSLYSWRRRFEQEGLPGLADRSRRPHTSPTRLPAHVAALICELRRQHPRWGARRISHELARRGTQPAASRATVHRVLVRNGLVNAQDQAHKRRYRRWQRAQPMHLWQLDLLGGVVLADGRECKLLTGIDDHSRFVVAAAVLAVPSGRAVCEAFSAAMRRYGVPSEVLTDNGKQFTGRYTKPQPAEVLFERVCRENGITARLTKPRSPTTTGKIERFHKTLRGELLNDVAPFASLAAAQQAIDNWVQTYNYQRPHQSLDMATPASRFRPNGPTRTDRHTQPAAPGEPPREAPHVDPPTAEPSTELFIIDVIETPPIPAPSAGAVEFDLRVPPSGATTIASTGQKVDLGKAWAGRTVTVWADQRSIHVSIDGRHLRTFASRLSEDHLRWLCMRGARPAGPAPGPAALARVNGRQVVPVGQAVEVDRTVRRDGYVIIGKRPFLVGRDYAYRQITVRLDGHLMHAICDGALIRTWPCPVTVGELPRLRGARTPARPLPPPPLPPGSFRVQRRVDSNGRVMVANQHLYIARSRRGQIVTVVVEDTYYRVLAGEEELKLIPRTSTKPITHVKVHAKHSRPSPEPASTRS
jgi:transposase InsO family protein